MVNFELGELIYQNPLSCPSDIEKFRIEGDPAITFSRGRMRLENASEPSKEHHANFLIWCPENFPDNNAVSWEFKPLSDNGLAMFWLAAKGIKGEDLFAHSLKPRDGNYPQYHHGDINALHVSYYRRNASEIGFQTCNLRKSYGFYLVCQGADPLPGARDAKEFYRMQVLKYNAYIRFSINELEIFTWEDDGRRYGNILKDGKIGFRQMAGLIAEYSNLKVYNVKNLM